MCYKICHVQENPRPHAREPQPWTVTAWLILCGPWYSLWLTLGMFQDFLNIACWLDCYRCCSSRFSFGLWEKAREKQSNLGNFQATPSSGPFDGRTAPDGKRMIDGKTSAVQLRTRPPAASQTSWVGTIPCAEFDFIFGGFVMLGKDSQQSA